MARQLITFHLGTQSFGLDIMAIREILAWSPTTRLPHVPHYVAGVVNLRGTVLPVIDLAARLGWEPTSPNDLRHVLLIEADLSRANFTNAQLRQANFTGAQKWGARVAGRDQWDAMRTSCLR